MINHILDIQKDKEELDELFKKIASGNTILFLGAGASVSDERKYLSKEIIDYYEEEIHRKMDTPDIIEFVDMLQATSFFDRNHFDNFVDKLLSRLPVTESHKIIASIKWREIITTNMDTLLEKAYDEIKNTVEQEFDLYPIRNIKESYNKVSIDQVCYTKLNGCLTDKSKYPFVFSSDDFNRVKPFYKKILQELRNLSYDVNFLSVGYSYSDTFAKQLLQKFDSYNYRNKKIMYSVDPFVLDTQLEYYKENKICIIRLTHNEFFNLYKNWENENYETLVKSKKISFYKTDDTQASIPPRLAHRLGEGVIQLNKRYKYDNISKVDFYKGEEPSYEVILKDYDVIRQSKINKIEKSINDYLESNISNIIPIIFIEGYFGIGKSTFVYRLLNEFQKDPETVVFEILDPTRINSMDLIELFQHSKAKTIFLLANFVERDSFFKSLLELRNNLNIEQISAFNVAFIAPIRENIIERYKSTLSMKNSLEIEIDAKLTEEEVLDLLEKLKSCELVEYRDIKEKNKLLRKIVEEYESQSIVTLLDLISDGKHFQDLLDAYTSLPPIAKKSFLYTSLLHQYKISMPISLLKNLVAKDWDEFINNLVKVDLKGILIQKKISSNAAMPDYYFVTRHPIIAQKLIERLITNNDDLFEKYEEIFKHIQTGEVNVRVAVDLLNILRVGNIFNESKINKLYDICYNSLSNEPYFLLYYCINLQHRRSSHDLERGVTLLKYAEALLEKRNHKFIHRRAVLNFELAKLYYEKEKELNLTYQYLLEAKELFLLKLLYDPGSYFSFVYYLNMELWILRHVVLSESEILRKKIEIEETIDLAEKSVIDNIDKIREIKHIFLCEYLYENDEIKYLKKLDEYYQDVQFRPYSLILKYNYFISHNKFERCKKIIDELEVYNYVDEVVKFLFKYYGRNLYIEENRYKFYEIIEKHPEIEKSDSIRFNYFKYVAESYEKRFQRAIDLLANIQFRHYHTINPDYKMTWKDETGIETIFNGYIIKNNKGYLKVKVNELQQSYLFINKEYKRNLVLNQNVNVKLHFFINGIKAEIIELC